MTLHAGWPFEPRKGEGYVLQQDVRGDGQFTDLLSDTFFQGDLLTVLEVVKKLRPDAKFRLIRWKQDGPNIKVVA